METNINSGVISERQALQYNVCVIAAAWVGFYRKELFNNIRYPAFKYYEDVGTSHRLLHSALHSAGKIVFVNQALYNHRIQRPNSITTSSTTKNHPDKREMIIRRIDDLCNWGYEEYAVVDAFRMLLKYGCTCSEQKPFVEKIHKLDAKLPKEYSWKQKVMLDVFKISPTLFNALCIMMGTRIK